MLLPRISQTTVAFCRTLVVAHCALTTVSGRHDAQLSVIANAVIISRLLYALPAWGGFLSVEIVNRINAFFRRLQRLGYLQCHVTVAELMNKSVL